ncbi:unnamed protein product [Ranitomeya imitator]|uniref:Uncharacterized protein n=1 Tax=Ranitomeya imitator TaxID=111125 RepID=A0ABN9MQ89_9NEOB|nr:unnamed protein product [Ranitomeya imitator]
MAIDQVTLGIRGGNLFKVLSQVESRCIFRLNSLTPNGLNDSHGHLCALNFKVHCGSELPIHNSTGGPKYYASQ